IVLPLGEDVVAARRLDVALADRAIGNTIIGIAENRTVYSFSNLIMAHGLIEPMLLERQETEVRLGTCIGAVVLTLYVQLLRRHLFQNRAGGIEFAHLSQRKPKVRYGRHRIDTVVARFAPIDR